MKLAKRFGAAFAASILLLGVAACGGSGTSSDGAGGDQILTTYNTPEKWANWGVVLKRFSEQTGIKAPNDPKNSGQALAAIQAEKAAPVADAVYLGIVFGLEADNNDLLDTYDSDKLSQLPDNLKSENGTWFTVHQGAISFLVNTSALGNTPIPQSWNDLTKPEYKGLVGFLDPTSAAVGYSVLSAANLSLGGSPDNWDPGIEWAKKMMANDVALPAQTATSAVQQGEIPILIDADFNGYQLANNDGAPIEVVLPAEGTISVPYVVAKVKGAPHPEAADAFLEYTLSDEAQTLFAEEFLQPVMSVDIPAEVRDAVASEEDFARLVATPDFKKLQDAMGAALERWKNEVIR